MQDGGCGCGLKFTGGGLRRSKTQRKAGKGRKGRKGRKATRKQKKVQH